LKKNLKKIKKVPFQDVKFEYCHKFEQNIFKFKKRNERMKKRKNYMIIKNKLKKENWLKNESLS
jgi:hypothetical protein